MTIGMVLSFKVKDNILIQSEKNKNSGAYLNPTQITYISAIIENIICNSSSNLLNVP